MIDTLGDLVEISVMGMALIPVSCSIFSMKLTVDFDVWQLLCLDAVLLIDGTVGFSKDMFKIKYNFLVKCFT